MIDTTFGFYTINSCIKYVLIWPIGESPNAATINSKTATIVEKNELTDNLQAFSIDS